MWNVMGHVARRLERGGALGEDTWGMLEHLVGHVDHMSAW